MARHKWELTLVHRLSVAGVALSLAGLLLPSLALAYSGSAAANYADEWAKSYNSAYPAFSDDCTNFVSQSLYAGGMPQVVYYDQKTGLPANTSDDYYWFIWDLTSSGTWVYAFSWTSAPYSRDHWIHYSGQATQIGTAPGTSTASTDGLAVGDVLYYDWGTGEGISHAAIQVGYGTDTNVTPNLTGDVVDEHTTNRYHAFWSLRYENSNYLTTTIYLVHM